MSARGFVSIWSGDVCTCLLASCSQQSLWALSVKNGSKQSWAQFSGQTNNFVTRTASNAGISVQPTTGSLLVLSPTDLSLPDYLAPGVIGSFNFQINRTVWDAIGRYSEERRGNLQKRSFPILVFVCLKATLAERRKYQYISLKPPSVIVIHMKQTKPTGTVQYCTVLYRYTVPGLYSCVACS